jgi:starch-binding outer membrane protein, SusD/RagB family
MSYKKYITVLMVTSAVFGGCKKLVQEPMDYITPDYVYNELDSTGNYANQVLNNLYSYLPNGYNRIDNVVLGAATDDAIASDNYSNIELLSRSTLTSVSTNPDGNWYRAYQAIRNVNLFLKNVDRVPVDDDIKMYWKGEARFIRSMSYFELIKRYGGVPLIGDSLFSQSDEINMPRNTFDQCVQYIVSEMDAIKPMLRPDPLSAIDLGRISQGVALALKSRALLYAASPLNNPGNDLNKWKAASDAAKAVIDYNKFSLLSSFVTVFTVRQNTEVILAFQRAQTQDVERNNAPVGYAQPNQSNGYVSPTQELVDAFPMKNGLDINATGSGYNAQNPYVNRDPRLNFTVFHNGSMWLKRAVETFEGGLDKPNTVQRQTRTGYYMRKFLADFSNTAAYGNQNHNFPIIRYAEILLNYAEAANEQGDINIAYDQLKAIRKRAGIDAGTGSMYGLKAAMTQPEMREAIRNERRLELAFEEHRFWDLRRWKTAEQELNKTLHGVRIVKNADNTFTYSVVPVFQMAFLSPRMYLYPIPFSEIGANEALVQNTGW